MIYKIWYINIINIYIYVYIYILVYVLDLEVVPWPFSLYYNNGVGWWHLVTSCCSLAGSFHHGIGRIGPPRDTPWYGLHVNLIYRLSNIYIHIYIHICFPKLFCLIYSQLWFARASSAQAGPAWKWCPHLGDPRWFCWKIHRFCLVINSN